MPADSKRFRLQFTIRTLLFVALCVGGLLAGYRLGFERGYSEGGAKWLREKPVTRVYPVSDLVLIDGRWPQAAGQNAALPDFQSMIDLITATVAPTSWDMVGGRGSIAPQLHALSIVVLQAPSVHTEIETLLSDLRRASESSAADAESKK